MTAAKSPFSPEAKAAELKFFANEMKKAIETEMANDTETETDAEFLLSIIANLEEDLEDVKDSKPLHQLDLRKQARVLADLTLLQGMLKGFEDDEMFDEDDFEDDFDEEGLEMEEENEDDDRPPTKGKSQIIKF